MMLSNKMLLLININEVTDQDRTSIGNFLNNYWLYSFKFLK